MQRVVKFCKYLSLFGWEPIVLTVKNGNYSSLDESLEGDVKGITHIFSAYSWEPHIIYKSLLPRFSAAKKNFNAQKKSKSKASQMIQLIAEYIRLNIFIPDSRIGWLRNAVKEGRKIVKAYQPNIILSSAPPYTAHLVARKLKSEFSIPWIADFRDPWLENHAYNTVGRMNLVKNINKKLELNTLIHADRVLTVGKGMEQLLQNKMPKSHADKVTIITNGYDEADFVDAPEQENTKFYISHFGELYWRRFPEVILQSLARILNDVPGCGKTLVLRVFGGVDARVRAAIECALPSANFEINPYITHGRILHLLQYPQLLLLTINNVANNRLIITGKIFEYIASGNPVLGIGPTDGDAANILTKSATGKMFEYKDMNDITQFVKQNYKRWEQHKLNKGVCNAPEFERKNLTQQLAGLLDACSNKIN